MIYNNFFFKEFQRKMTFHSYVLTQTYHKHMKSPMFMCFFLGINKKYTNRSFAKTFVNIANHRLFHIK